MSMWKDSESPATQRAFAAMMDMKKLDIAKLKAAYKEIGSRRVKLDPWANRATATRR
jgi:hypothetical protein